MRDANVIIRGDGLDLVHPGFPEIEQTGIAAAQIIRILHRKCPSPAGKADVLLVVRYHEPYEEERGDPYRGFGFSLTGCLFKKRYSSDLRVVHAEDIVCQFIRTEYQEYGPESSRCSPYIHVLPLVRVCSMHPCLSVDS